MGKYTDQPALNYLLLFYLYNDSKLWNGSIVLGRNGEMVKWWNHDMVKWCFRRGNFPLATCALEWIFSLEWKISSGTTSQGAFILKIFRYNSLLSTTLGQLSGRILSQDMSWGRVVLLYLRLYRFDSFVRKRMCMSWHVSLHKYLVLSTSHEIISACPGRHWFRVEPDEADPRRYCRGI